MAEAEPTILSIFKGALGDRVDPSAANWLELMSPDLVMEFPFARPGMRPRIEGLAEVIPYLMSVAQGIRADTFDNVVVHETQDPEVVIVEFEAHGRALDLIYISVIRTRGGKMIHYKDYWNPIQGLKAQVGSAAVDAFILGGAAGREGVA